MKQEIEANQTSIGRRETISGKDYAIYPLVLMVEGVHHAVNGDPVYYPPSVLESSVLHWDGRPIPIYHPNIAGDYVRANNPQVEADWVCGRIYNAMMDNGKLKAEAWLEISKAEQLHPGLIMALDSGTQMEVSTGVMVSGDGVSGTWNEEAFNQSITTMIPDHLALLPGDKGACSWEDGCGVRANKSKMEENEDNLSKIEINEKKVFISIRNNNIIKNQGKLGINQTSEDSEKKMEDSTNNNLLFAINQLQQTKDLPQALVLLEDMAFEFLDLKKAKMSFGQMEEAVRAAVRALNSKPILEHEIGTTQGIYHWVREVYEDSVIYDVESSNPPKIYKRSYSRNDDGTVTLLDDAVEVKEERQFVPLNNQEGEQTMAEKTPCCPAKVDALIANEHTAYTEADRAGLNEMGADMIDKLSASVQILTDNAFTAKADAATAAKEAADLKAKCAKLNANAATAPSTAEEFIGSAPPEIAALLSAGLLQLNAKKTAMITSILGNSRNTFTEAQLNVLSADQLEQIAALATTTDFSLNAQRQPAPTETAEVPYVTPLNMFDVKQ